MAWDDFRFWLLGMLKSWTIWAGAIVISLPDWWPLVADDVAPLLSEGAYAALVRIIGIAMIVLRIKTVQSLADKGAR